ncbi:MAG: hypothetical protein LBU65_15655 [Planctomycetaceae bacterium]|jgi:hypothetical protein|nr:hypothetical protein [Planctomycetaceae bacterium]
MFRVLKYDRWLSFVFAHKDPEFWDLIINTAEQCGFEYIGAVSQKNGQTSFKKRQRPFTVLSGQLIINFRKVRNPKTLMKVNLGMDITEIVINSIESIIAKHQGATLEQINAEFEEWGAPGKSNDIKRVGRHSRALRKRLLAVKDGRTKRVCDVITSSPNLADIPRSRERRSRKWRGTPRNFRVNFIFIGASTVR